MSVKNMKITEIATPALIIDEEIFDANLKLMAELCGHKLRPHFKSHKCPEISLKQIAAGASGDAQPGQNEHACAFVRRLPDQGDDLPHVCGGIRQMQPGYARGKGDDSVFHI